MSQHIEFDSPNKDLTQSLAFLDLQLYLGVFSKNHLFFSQLHGCPSLAFYRFRFSFKNKNAYYKQILTILKFLLLKKHTKA